MLNMPLTAKIGVNMKAFIHDRCFADFASSPQNSHSTMFIFLGTAMIRSRAPSKPTCARRPHDVVGGGVHVATA